MRYLIIALILIALTGCAVPQPTPIPAPILPVVIPIPIIPPAPTSAPILLPATTLPPIPINIPPQPVVKEGKPVFTRYEVVIQTWPQSKGIMEILFTYLDQDGEKISWTDIGGKSISVFIKSGDKVFWGRNEIKMTNSIHFSKTQIDQSFKDCDVFVLETKLYTKDDKEYEYSTSIPKEILSK